MDRKAKEGLGVWISFWNRRFDCKEFRKRKAGEIELLGNSQDCRGCAQKQDLDVLKGRVLLRAMLPQPCHVPGNNETFVSVTCLETVKTWYQPRSWFPRNQRKLKNLALSASPNAARSSGLECPRLLDGMISAPEFKLPPSEFGLPQGLTFGLGGG